MWDVGAGVGVYTLFALERVGIENVVAFEFHEDLVTGLLRNCRHAGYQDVQLCGLGLDGAPDETVVAEQRTDVDPELLESGADLVELGYAEPAPTILGIDRGGLEPAILQGFTEAQIDRIRAIYLPIYDDETRAWFEDVGYDVEVLVEQPPRPGHWYEYARIVSDEPGLLDRLTRFLSRTGVET